MAVLRPVGLSQPLAPARQHCVVAFARPVQRPVGLSMRDRIELERWSRAAAAFGITRVRLEAAEPSDPEWIGHILLIYSGGEEWARWGVAAREDGLVEVWSTAKGHVLGCYSTLAEALAEVVAV